jgi:crotonyl-CoA reductase
VVPYGLSVDVRTAAFGILKESNGGRQFGFFEVSLPDLADDEVLIRVRAAGLNFNSIWSLDGRPADPFQLMSGMVRNNPGRENHLQPYQIIGSDASAVVVAVGGAVTKWADGDEVVVHCSVVDLNDPVTEHDDLLSQSQAIWGYETNFGAFARYAIVREHQLHQKPPHLSWEDAASYMLTLTTAYRMLLSSNGARLSSGETCLVWGASGGLGMFALQLARIVGARTIAVVSSDDRAQACMDNGADSVINRNEMKHPLVDEAGRPNPMSWKEWKKKIRSLSMDEPEVVFEHVGRETLAASMYLARRGGRIVTCAASSGFETVIDLRYLWMQVKSVIGSHISNRQEAAEANQLVMEKRIVPVVSHQAAFGELPVLLDHLRAGRVVGKAVVSVSGDKKQADPLGGH